MIKVSKYEFDSEEQAIGKINALPSVKDEEGNVSVDHPYGWKSYAIDIDNEGMHGFMGVSYIENKM